MISVILHALAPIFFVMSLGYVAGKTKRVDNSHVLLLNQFVMDFALPAALFSATAQTPWRAMVEQYPLIIILAIAMWLIYGAIYWLARKGFNKSAQDATVLALTVALPNYAALGLPVLSSVYGEGLFTSLSVAVSIACGSVLLTPLALLVLEREKARSRQEDLGSPLIMLVRLIGRSAQAPIVWAPLVGVLLSLLDIPLPELLLSAMKPLAISATATALFLTGLILSARRLQINRVVIIASCAKLVLQPLIGWGTIVILGYSAELAATGVLMLSLSAGFFGVVLGNRFDVRSPDSEAVLLLTSLFTVVSLPVFMHFSHGL